MASVAIRSKAVSLLLLIRCLVLLLLYEFCDAIFNVPSSFAINSLERESWSFTFIKLLLLYECLSSVFYPRCLECWSVICAYLISCHTHLLIRFVIESY